MLHPSPPCPRCEYDTSHVRLAHRDGHTTYRCYACEYLFVVDDDVDLYLGDDARLDAITNLYPTKESDNVD